MYSFQGIRRNAAVQCDRLAFAALALLAASFALEVLHPFVTLANWQFTNLEVLQMLVCGLWLAARLVDGHWRRLPRRLPTWLAVSLTLWLAALIASTATAASYQFSAIVFDTRIIRGALIGWVAFASTRSAQRWTTLIRAFALGGIVIYLAGLLEATKQPSVIHWLESIRGTSIYVGDVLRISSTLPYPTIAAMCIELTLFPLLAWFLAAKQCWLRGLLGAGLLSGLVALVLTSSRGGLIALMGGLAVMAALALYYGYRRLILLGGAALVGSLLVVIGLLIANNPALALRFISENGESWYRAIYRAADHVAARPGETLSISVQVTNTGLYRWASTGNSPFHLSYHLLLIYPNLRLGILYEGTRSMLPTDVAPGQSVTVTATIPTPNDPGEYVIRWDMVEESVTWFSTQNAPTSDTLLSLSGEPVTDGEIFTFGSFDDVPVRPVLGRLALWQTALTIVRAYPWLGVGPDNFRYRYGTYASVPNSDMRTHANNLYIEWLADTGILGLLAFLGFNGLVLLRAGRNLKQYLHSQQWIWQLAVIGSLVAWYIHGLVDYFYEFMPTNTAFWLLVALAVRLAISGSSQPEHK